MDGLELRTDDVPMQIVHLDKRHADVRDVTVDLVDEIFVHEKIPPFDF